MIAQIKDDKLKLETKSTVLPLHNIFDKEGIINSTSKLTGANLSPVKTVLVKKENYNEASKIETESIKEITMSATHESSEIDTNRNQTSEILDLMNNFTLEACNEIPSNLQGKLQIVKEVMDFPRILSENPLVLVGGESSPANCQSRHNVAIIIPYRNRLGQLAVFLRHIHPILSRQDLHYRIYIINQGDENTFNRAMLMNVGYTEAMQDYSWDCCIFHDVDLLPEDDRNLYTCPDMPRHMSVAVDKFKYKLPYKTIFGGVAAIRVKQFITLNGFSNQFWGWGGEDDDMSKRIHYHKLKITRYKPEIARYTMLKHKQEKVNKERAKVLRSSHRRYKTDGLNSLKYNLMSKELRPLYTNVTVALNNPGKQEEILERRMKKYKEMRHKPRNKSAVRIHHP